MIRHSFHTNLHKFEKNALWLCVVLNASVFITEIILGWISHSSAMIGDSLDSFGDAATYGVALFAIYRLNGKKEDKTIWLGVIQICLASVILEEVIRRSIMDNNGEDINFGLMMGMTCASLAGNITCSTVLFLSRRRKNTDVNVKASFIFSAIDVYENTFTIIAAIIILYTKSNIPDLVGGCVFFTVISTSSIILFRKHYLSTKKRTTA